jgi:hypothetical protein
VPQNVSFAPGLVSPDAPPLRAQTKERYGMGIQLRIAGAALALALFAQAANAQDNTQVLPTLVVSPTAVPTPVNEIANSLTVITGQDMEREQRRTVTDALTAVPGLQVVQNGSSGAQTSVFIRGTNSAAAIAGPTDATCRCASPATPRWSCSSCNFFSIRSSPAPWAS